MTDAQDTSKLVPYDLYRRLCRARELINDAYGEPLTTEVLAEKAGLSPFHFLRCFTQAFGETPHAYLTRIRIERAKKLLMAENLPVTEVCLEVGFSSLGSFSTLFSRQVGQSPSLYRCEMGRIYQLPGHYPRIIVPNCFVTAFFGLPSVPQ